MILRVAALAALFSLGAVSLAGAADTTYNLLSVNGTGETGTVTLAPTPDGKGTIVTIATQNAVSDLQPAHVHNGSCLALGGVVYPLQTVQNGKSVTTLKEVPVSALTSGKYAINVHKSTSDIATYVSCVNLAPPGR